LTNTASEKPKFYATRRRNKKEIKKFKKNKIKTVPKQVPAKLGSYPDWHCAQWKLPGVFTQNKGAVHRVLLLAHSLISIIKS